MTLSGFLLFDSGMYQTIDETIAVAGVYNQSSFVPKKFRWHQQTLKIDQITLISDTKDGGVRKRLYSVMSGGNVYRLEFNRDTEQWLLNQLWFDG